MEPLTLESLREILESSLMGRRILPALWRIVKAVKENEKVDTIGIDKNGVIYWSPSFWTKCVTSPDIAAFVIWHEICHQVLKDLFLSEALKLSERASFSIINIAMDMRINSLLYRICCKGKTNIGASGRAIKVFLCKFNPTYPGRLLAPICRPRSAHGRGLFLSVWRPDGYRDTSMYNIFVSLLSLLRNEGLASVRLLGSHAGGAGEEGTTASGTKAAIGELQEAFADTLETIGKEAGFSDTLIEQIIKDLRSAAGFKTKFIKTFSARHALGQLKRKIFKKIAKSPAVIPIRPSRRDLALLTSGYVPFIWNNQRIKHTKDRSTLNIYVDVSGSFWEDLPRVISFIRHLSSSLKEVYLFSNKVVPTTIQKLLKGEVDTTGGTDADCFLIDIAERKPENAVVITDGYYRAKKENIQAVADLGTKVYILLTEQCDRDASKDIAKATNGFVDQLSHYVE